MVFHVPKIPLVFTFRSIQTINTLEPPIVSHWVEREIQFIEYLRLRGFFFTHESIYQIQLGIERIRSIKLQKHK